MDFGLQHPYDVTTGLPLPAMQIEQRYVREMPIYWFRLVSPLYLYRKSNGNSDSLPRVSKDGNIDQSTTRPSSFLVSVAAPKDFDRQLFRFRRGKTMELDPIFDALRFYLQDQPGDPISAHGDLDYMPLHWVADNGFLEGLNNGAKYYF